MIASKKTIRMCTNVLWLLSLLIVCSVCIAQTPPTNPTTSVSGRVTIAGKGAEGITVVATVAVTEWQNRTIAKAVTDGEGNYTLTRLAAGQLTIMPIAKAFVIDGSGVYKQPGQLVNVTEDESITKIDFVLARGGVITGRVTDLDGRPIIGESVDIMREDGSRVESVSVISSESRSMTDDRGVFRMYGLGPGNYKVSVGRVESSGTHTSFYGGGGSQYTKTFYPDVADASKAKAIEISEGTEAANIDITPGKFARGFSVSGRAVDADSNKPVANAIIAYSTVSGENQTLGGMNFTGSQTDSNGKFHLEGIEPGNYAAFTMTMGQENSYSDPTPFYISTGDVAGIEIKVRRGATIEGVAVIENNVDPATAALLQSVSMFAYVSLANSSSSPSYSLAKINPDGSFRFMGLGPGNARIQTSSYPNTPNGLELVRTELNGQEQPNGIEVTASARVTGVRLVFSYGTGKIRGEVKTQGGVWPEGMTVMLTINAVDGPTRYSRSINVDARGHFLAENIPPGSYELLLRPYAAEFEPVRRTITVANGLEVPVTIVIDLLDKESGPE